jgi:hypothetical protein
MPGRKRGTAGVHDWEKAKAAVLEHRDTLAAFEDHASIYAWAKENGFATKSLFPKLKIELHKQLGVDYEAMREAAYALRREQIAAAAADGPLIEIYTAADGQGSFAVCGPDGAVVAYGSFHSDDRVFIEGDQTSADLSTAEFAVFIAGQAREELDVEAVRLRLHVLNHEVSADDPVLARAAMRARVDLSIEVSHSNAALEWTQEPGYKQWRETNLVTLVVTEQMATGGGQ